MDATSLAFHDQSFDTVVCIEAAQHFRTREKFLAEALRILKAGGTLAMTDLLLYEDAAMEDQLYPPENHVLSLVDYREKFLKSGFSQVEVMDITASGWGSYARSAIMQMHEMWFAGSIPLSVLQGRLSFVYSGMAKFSHNLMVIARK